MWFVYLCLAGGLAFFFALDIWVSSKLDFFAYRGYEMLAKVAGPTEFKTINVGVFRNQAAADRRLKQNP